MDSLAFLFVFLSPGRLYFQDLSGSAVDLCDCNNLWIKYASTVLTSVVLDSQPECNGVPRTQLSLRQLSQACGASEGKCACVREIDR